MTDTDRAINYRLRNEAGVVAINESGTSARVYPLRRPDGSSAATCIVYTLVTENGDSNLAEEDQLKINRYQVSAFASASRAAAKALADAIKTALHTYSGTLDGQVIGKILYVPGSRQEQYDDDSKLYQVTRDYEVFFN